MPLAWFVQAGTYAKLAVSQDTALTPSEHQKGSTKRASLDRPKRGSRVRFGTEEDGLIIGTVIRASRDMLVVFQGGFLWDVPTREAEIVSEIEALEEELAEIGLTIPEAEPAEGPDSQPYLGPYPDPPEGRDPRRDPRAGDQVADRRILDPGLARKALTRRVVGIRKSPPDIRDRVHWESVGRGPSASGSLFINSWRAWACRGVTVGLEQKTDIPPGEGDSDG